MKGHALVLAILFLATSLSGCLGLGRGGEGDITDRTPSDVQADEYNVLYIGHSFGRRFADQLEEYAHTAGVSNHAQYIVFSGGASGAPDALWDDAADRERIKEFLDTGEIDVLVLICCSLEFIGSGLQTDEAVWNFTTYAVAQNPNVRIGLSMPWKDFPGNYSNASEHATDADVAFDGWASLGHNLSADFDGLDVFTINHALAAYELRRMFEAGELDGDVEQLTGPKPTSVFTDEKGHAGQILLDTGTMMWLEAVHGVAPTAMPAFTEWEADIRDIAQRLVDGDA